MKITFRSVVSLLAVMGMLLPLSLSAQDAAKPKKNKASGQSSVWKIEGENCTVYLAGSVHMLRRQDLPLPKQFQTAYEDSEALVFEMKPFEDDGAEAQAKSLEQGSFEKGKTLKDELSDEGYAALGDYLAAAGLPKSSMDQFRPWMVSIAITGIEMMKAGVSPEYGVETVLEKRGRKDKKSMSGLETIEEQLSVFEDMEEDSGERMLLETLAESVTLAESFPKLVRAWKSGNGKALMRLNFEDLDDPEASEMYETILFARNRNWIAPIEKMIAGGTNTMVVVGAGHLYGNKSVIDLLEKKGYKVERLLVPEKGKGKAKGNKNKKEKPEKMKEPVPEKKSQGRLIPV